ncbi:MAG TPA: hypothetical protein VFS02_10535, partial [Telluria sp.]|nr:hypothetical protein [Telluria sp.]
MPDVDIQVSFVRLPAGGYDFSPEFGAVAQRLLPMTEGQLQRYGRVQSIHFTGVTALAGTCTRCSSSTASCSGTCGSMAPAKSPTG